ncbi:MAG: energy-coupling factor transporter transmembrane protein EcfT, partial [Clostridia bacterium]|nr:energy-coupling factor transporter transmembrane protein EcfT [Clostridia bacterium]
MIRDITFGQYYPGKSVLHRMDPRMKLVLTFAMIVAVFICHNFYALALMVVFAAAAVLLSRVPLRMILKSIKPILIILAFTAVLNIFYTKGGATYFEWWKISVTEKGVNTAIFTVIRIIVLVVISSLLTYTTTPTMLTDAIERLLSPLKIFHIKV